MNMTGIIIAAAVVGIVGIVYRLKNKIGRFFNAFYNLRKRDIGR